MKGFQDTQSTRVPLLATDLHLELDIIHHRASLKLLQLNAGETHYHTELLRNYSSAYTEFVLLFILIEMVKLFPAPAYDDI